MHGYKHVHPAFDTIAEQFISMHAFKAVGGSEPTFLVRLVFLWFPAL